MSLTATFKKHRRLAGVTAAAGLLVAGLVVGTSSIASADSHAGVSITSTGLQNGQIKHVWLIILENKSYDATFTGLNQNSYLWKTLPAQGVLLKNYYGTGHFSQDNYISHGVRSGAPSRTPSPTAASRTSTSAATPSIIKTGANKGQVASLANAAQPSGPTPRTASTAAPTRRRRRRCSTSSTPPARPGRATRQDLGNQPGREDAVCGGPGTAANNPTTNPTFMSATAAHPFPAGVTSFTGAQANDQYVAKHFPFPWFHALTGTQDADRRDHRPGLTTPVGGGTDCDAQHIANLDSASHGPVPRPAARVDDSGVQLDHAEQLQRRARRDLQGQQPVRLVHRERQPDLPDADAEPGVDHAEELHRRPVRLRPVPRVLHPDDREVARRSRTAA